MSEIKLSETQKSFVESKWFVVLLGTLTAFDPLTIDMYLPAFGDIQKNFQTTMSNVELSVSTFFIGMAFGQLIYGPLADRFGRRLPLLGGMFVYLLATIACAYAPNIEIFIVCRLLQALGGCAGMVVTRAIIRDLFDKQRVAEFLSNMALVMGIAPIIAPSLGALINASMGWRAIFLTLAGANVLCMICIFLFLPETSHHRALSISPKAVFKSYIGLLKSRHFVGYLIPDAAVRAGMFAYIAGSPFVFIELFKIPSSQYGFIFGLNGLGLMAASQINRRLLRRWTPEVILRWSVRIAALAAAFVFAWTWLGLAPVVVLISLFIFLATLNFVGPNSLAGALASQGHQAGTASALYGCLQWSMASFSSFLVSSFHNGTAFPMTGTILFCGLLSVVAFQVLVKNPKV
ncbi:multidrug effflux MFS transporter [Bdellovibrio sp. HCB288]|uniref:multidrug effflux MFS transporter n=1 Tax=Bdellovibrio sp. HCB288 TaxID=3394355 RepID=UPI0039B36A10